MANFMSFITLICILSLSRRPAFAADTPEGSSLRTYIVHVERPDGEERTADQSEDLESWYRSFLPPPREAQTRQTSVCFTHIVPCLKDLLPDYHRTR
ncbi:UNVERIFIED_CONTAM: hypothetical protein Sangu_1692600 [Sesamum angustifolium]|uniref:Secreted protein n=1 Tax=Sesamum angustifolium TaxID=2727405 RepID=A0AAW2MK37_9LAMI